MPCDIHLIKKGEALFFFIFLHFHPFQKLGGKAWFILGEKNDIIAVCAVVRVEYARSHFAWQCAFYFL